MTRNDQHNDHADRRHLQRALDLARGGRGRTSPNPLTGCVVVKHGRVIGEGFHRQHGAPHAEAAALDACAEDPRGAHLYCNLEPCARVYPGKLTPPCAGRVIRAGIGRVTIATLDPAPQVNGAGVRTLRAAGIEVAVGELAEPALRLNLPFFTAVLQHRPFVHLKAAQSLDGRIATAGGNSRWITDEAARAVAHELRAAHDAVLVGRGTALTDNPRLTVRLGGGSPAVPGPWRVVLDPRLELPPSAHLVSDRLAARTLVLAAAGDGPGAEPFAARRQALEAHGARVVPVAAHAGGRLVLPAILGALYDRGIRSILVEGGGTVYTSFLQAGLFDQLTLFVAPLLLGRGVELVGDLTTRRVADAVRLQGVTTRIINDQVMISGYRDLDRMRRLVVPAAEREEAAPARAG